MKRILIVLFFLPMLISRNATAVDNAPTGTGGNTCIDNGLDGTSDGFSQCCAPGTGTPVIVQESDGSWDGWCEAGDTTPATPGNGGGTSGDPTGSGGGGGGNTCNAQCQKDQKYAKCMADSAIAYASCNQTNKAEMAFCSTQWAVDTAVGACTDGDPNGLNPYGGGHGIDGQTRKRIWGPIAKVCKLQNWVNPKTGEFGQINVCTSVSGPNGLPYFSDDQLNGASAWQSGSCTAGAYKQGGCMAEWMNGKPDCTVGGSGAASDTYSASFTVSLPRVNIAAGANQTATEAKTFSVHYGEKDGLGKVCTEAYKQIANHCKDMKAQRQASCQQEYSKP